MEQHQFGLREWADLCERKDATIAALQARVQELEQAAKETHGRFISEQAAKKDVIDELTVALKSDADGQVLIDKLMQDVLKLESQLTQRTAELEAAKKVKADYDRWLSGGVYFTTAEYMAHIDEHRAELERVRLLSSHNERRFEMLEKKYKELRALILALPKVEGAVVVSNGYVKDSTRCHALFGADEDAALYAALLQERQKLC